MSTQVHSVLEGVRVGVKHLEILIGSLNHFLASS